MVSTHLCYQRNSLTLERFNQMTLDIPTTWKNISAVESSNVYFLDDTLASNWGTTTVQLVEELSTTFEESAQTNVYSDQLLLISLLFLVIMTFVLTRRNTKQKV